jgi:hypothetical protein
LLSFKEGKASAIIVATSAAVAIAEPFLAVTTPFARMALSRRLLSEPYLDAALHDVLLHLPSQIPDHMPCTDSFLVLLPSIKNRYISMQYTH